MKITLHALSRYLERTGTLDSIRNKIFNIVLKGREVRPKYEAVVLMDNGFKDARYYHLSNLVAVVCDNKIVTVVNYDRSKWRA